MSPFFEIPWYHGAISPTLARNLLRAAKPVAGIPGLVELNQGGETEDALRFLVALYDEVKADLRRVLLQRTADRKFLDERVAACHEFNRVHGIDWLSNDYHTVIGLEDANGRVVIGPLGHHYCQSGGKPVAPLPSYLQGPHVTLFGPPDSAKMAINAMNAWHRRLPGEPPIVAKLLEKGASPMWGADDEDSKTPLRQNLCDAAENLSRCFDGSLHLEENGRSYELAKDHLSLPIKRFPGLAMPAPFLFWKENPIPLHLWDFALHLFRNWHNPRALVFYVPKLENEEEAAYVAKMIRAAEARIQKIHPEYKLGTVRLMIVLENPRAILRAHEIMDALYPYFAGASLGWHDYLASMARIFREEPHYRIPVKADPDIVIKYIKASHLLLADAVGSRGGIQVGGMYGILPITGKERSLHVTLKGFIRDVVTQMKRNLTGYWVAHPDFVRIGLALVEAWKLRSQGNPGPLTELVSGLLPQEFHHDLFNFIDGPDIEGLDKNDPQYVRSLIVADIKESDFIPNHHPDEIRYNVFQSLQYLTDWLSGNGCVALPTVVEGEAVRVMDDLATAERSRWEVWHEIRHGRFSLEDFLCIVHEEMNFIRRDLSNEKKIVQVKWDERTSRWYPIAQRLMLQLMTDPEPAEFATELLLPFTLDEVRNASDPWAAAVRLDADKFRLPPKVEKWNHWFEVCGCRRFADEMTRRAVVDLPFAESLVKSFSEAEIQEAASFHGDIGQSSRTLDALAAGEQAEVKTEKAVLCSLGDEYRKKFGFKFLVSAKGKTGEELLKILQARISRSRNEEITAAREALWEISRKRIHEACGLSGLEVVRKKHGIRAASLAVIHLGHVQEIALGCAQPNSKFQIASLSKTVASAYCCELFRDVNRKVEEIPGMEGVTLAHLMSHSALSMHYVKGFSGPVPPVEELIQGKHGYDPVKVIAKPGREFHYSGGGYLVLQHLVEKNTGKPAALATKEFLQAFPEITLDTSEIDGLAPGHLRFPAFAAGGYATARGMARFLQSLEDAYHSVNGAGPISHDTAVQMLHGTDRGCRDFMGCFMGLGVFVAEAGSNRLMIHQGANEGYRAIYVHCFAGPDRGKGFVIFSEGDNEAVPFVAEVAQTLIRALGIQGVGEFTHDFQSSSLPQEQIVNLGYKKLLFDAFLPDLPEEILVKGPVSAAAASNLAAGAFVLRCSNQKFARAENLVSSHEPVFDPELFGRQGKIMDSWETARHNETGQEYLELRLLRPGRVRFVELSTRFHDGNQMEWARLLGRRSSKDPWKEFLPAVKLVGHGYCRVDLNSLTEEFQEIRVEAGPDGGLTRLGLWSEPPPGFSPGFGRYSDAIPKAKKPLTIPFAGSRVVHASNEHYGPAAQVISPFPPIHMFDGLESARSRVPGHHEEVTIALEHSARIKKVELDFTFFVNNNPVEVALWGRTPTGWIDLSGGRVPVKAFAGNRKIIPVNYAGEISEIRLETWPDGGVNRIRVFSK